MQAQCMTKFCEQNEFIAKNDDVLVGFVGWAAGAFDDTYLLTLMPSKSGDTWTDNKLMQQCILAPFGKGRATTSTRTTSPSTTSPSTTKSLPTVAPTGSNSTEDDGANQLTISRLCILIGCISALHLI